MVSPYRRLGDLLCIRLPDHPGELVSIDALQVIHVYLSTIRQGKVLSIQLHKHRCMFHRADKDDFAGTRTKQISYI